MNKRATANIYLINVSALTGKEIGITGVYCVRDAIMQVQNGYTITPDDEHADHFKYSGVKVIVDDFNGNTIAETVIFRDGVEYPEGLVNEDVWRRAYNKALIFAEEQDGYSVTPEFVY